jgi:hypothetical protein
MTTFRRTDIGLTKRDGMSLPTQFTTGRLATLIAPDWTLLFSTKRGRWWVRLLACGRYNHVKAIAYLPAMRAWLFYDVKFNGTRLMIAGEDEPGTAASLRDYLDGCDLLAMPPLAVPKRIAPHLGFWCTLAMKHLVGIRTAALRPDRLWRDGIAAGGMACRPDGDEAALSFLRAHSESSNAARDRKAWLDEAAFARQRRGDATRKLRIRIRAFFKWGMSGRRKRSFAIASSARC